MLILYWNWTRTIHSRFDSNFHFLFSSSRSAYLKNCNCLMNCNITIYSTKIVNRKEMDELNAPNSIISLYYSSNLVTKLSEVVGYDWNQFLSDIGGSLGFLLGNYNIYYTLIPNVFILQYSLGTWWSLFQLAVVIIFVCITDKQTIIELKQ